MEIPWTGQAQLLPILARVISGAQGTRSLAARLKLEEGTSCVYLRLGLPATDHGGKYQKYWEQRHRRNLAITQLFAFATQPAGRRVAKNEPKGTSARSPGVVVGHPRHRWTLASALHRVQGP